MALEDYTTYVETDPNSTLSVAANTITQTNANQNEDARVTLDLGTGYFSGDFTHLVDGKISTAGTFAVTPIYWQLANVLKGGKTIFTDGDDYFRLQNYNDNNGPTNYKIDFYEKDNGTLYSDSYAGATQYTHYWYKVVRDESVGTYGTLYAYIYDDSGRTNLVDTLTITLHTSKKDWQYIYAFSTMDDTDNRTYSGTVNNLDIERVGGPVLKTANTVAAASIKTRNTVA
jgi:hypothetical protein